MAEATGSDGNTATKVHTNVEEFTDDKGRRVRKTTKTTTTVTIKGGKKTTSTKSEVTTEFVDGGSTSNKTEVKLDNHAIGGGVDKAAVKGSSKPAVISSKHQRQFEEECIKRHNELRQKHGAKPLTANENLRKTAQKWADHLVSIGRMQHSGAPGLGENVAYKFSSDKRRFGGNEIADMWYDEIKKYDFNKPGFASGTGHFTQVVWEESKEVGVGVAADGRGTIFAVANYLPPGNTLDQFPKNVKPPRK